MSTKRFSIRSAITRLIVPLSLLATVASACHAEGKGFQMASWGTSKADLKVQVLNLSKMGANLVRFPIYFSFDPSVQNWISTTKSFCQTAASLGITVVVTFHHPTPNVLGSEIYSIPDFKARWKAFATGLKSERNVWFNLANEPKGSYQGVKWANLALDTATDIRRIDPSRKIVVAAPGITLNGLRGFQPPSISNMVVEAHAYDWNSDQMATFAKYPNPATTFNKENIQTRLSWAVNFQNQYHVPVYIGEVAIRSISDVGIPNPYAAQFLKDFTNECSRLGLSLTLHAYREAPLWNYEFNAAAWSVVKHWL